MNGVIRISENIAKRYIIEFEASNVTISKTVTFLSNICSILIYLISKPFMLLIEHTNIMFISNIIYYQVIVSEATTSNDYRGGEHGGAEGAIAPPLCKVEGLCPPLFIYYFYSKLIINTKK